MHRGLPPAFLVFIAGLFTVVGLPTSTYARSLRPAPAVVSASGPSTTPSASVRRIVALNSDSLEVLRTLGAEDLVVGVFSEIDREKSFWGDLVHKPKVGSWRDPNFEAIVSLNPDLVIAYSRNPGPVLERKLAPFHITVLRLDLYKIETLEREVILLGKLLQRRREAERFCRWHRARLQEIEIRLHQVRRQPKIYLETYTDFHTVGPGSGGAEMCRLAGGRNIARYLSIPYPRVTPEWVVAKDPDIIVKPAAHGNGYALQTAAPFNRIRDAVMRRPAWDQISAVLHGRVHVIDSAVWTGPRSLIGIAYLVRWFHPGLFANLDPSAWHREYLETFQHIPYQGVFVSDDPGRSSK